MDVYASLGARRIINAHARLTRLGGSLMPPEVLDAMRAAAATHVDLFDLQGRVGARLATLTRNEAACVCTGASAGLFLATLACMVGDNLHAIAHLPEIVTGRDEVLVHHVHRIPYDPAIRLAGAKLVTVGNALQTFAWELEAAFTPRTAAVWYVAGAHLSRGALPLSDVIALAHERGVPVIVDAAAQLPPVESLWHFSRGLGADLVVFSGGKDLRGPQASGLIVGRPDLIAACTENGAPHQRLGRPMKVGKEEMIGLLAAVERYLALDHAARAAGFEATVRGWVEAVVGLPGVAAARAFPNEAGQPVPRAAITFAPESGVTAAAVAASLWAGEPAIAAAAAGDTLYLTPDCLEPGKEQVVAARLVAMLRGATATVSAR